MNHLHLQEKDADKKPKPMQGSLPCQSLVCVCVLLPVLSVHGEMSLAYQVSQTLSQGALCGVSNECRLCAGVVVLGVCVCSCVHTGALVPLHLGVTAGLGDT